LVISVIRYVNYITSDIYHSAAGRICDKFIYMSQSLPFPLPRALLFDLDGTLQDTYAIHYQAFRATFAHYGRTLTEEQYQAAYAPNWFLTYQMLDFPEELWAEADGLWLAEAGKHCPQPFPGVLEILAALKLRFPLGLVTAGQRERVTHEISQNGLRDYFQVIVTGDDVDHPKPAPDAVRMALEALGIPPAESVYIGDTDLDYQTAVNAGTGFIGIHSQFNSLSPELPIQILPDITQLLTLLA
jgi:HAD superfamily hydrolase (TIGR01509 family)